MADIYDRALATATRMLKPRSEGGYGLLAELKVSVTGAYDPSTGTSPVVETTYSGSAFRDTYKREEIDGSRILANDVKFLVSPVLLSGATTPLLSPEDKIAFDGTTYTVISVAPWNYAGLNVGFEVQGRL